jgi:SsrA-binding protein
MAKSGNKNPSEEEKVRIIARNRKALHDYKVLSQLECGLVLQGSEVKSLRSNQANISDSFARIEKGEIWLYGMDIPEYTEANQLNHKAKRRRKMLLNRSEIRKFEVEMKTRGKSLIPLELYFKKGKAKISLALGLGQKFHDKRENIKKKETQKDIAAFQARKRKGS